MKSFYIYYNVKNNVTVIMSQKVKDFFFGDFILIGEL